MAKRPLSLPAVMAKVRTSPSGSEAVTVPTTVPGNGGHAEKVAGSMVGGSLTGVTVTVTSASAGAAVAVVGGGREDDRRGGGVKGPGDHHDAVGFDCETGAGTEKVSGSPSGSVA